MPTPMTSSRSWAFRAWALAVPGPLARRSSTCKVTRPWATTIRPLLCRPGTPLPKAATRSAGSTAATASSSGAATGATSGRCGDSSRTAATTSSPTDSPPTTGRTTAPVLGLASFLLGLPAVKQRQAGIPQMKLAPVVRRRLCARQLSRDCYHDHRDGPAL